jgi:hypothetical protein
VEQGQCDRTYRYSDQRSVSECDTAQTTAPLDPPPGFAEEGECAACSFNEPSAVKTDFGLLCTVMHDLNSAIDTLVKGGE